MVSFTTYPIGIANNFLVYTVNVPYNYSNNYSKSVRYFTIVIPYGYYLSSGSGSSTAASTITITETSLPTYTVYKNGVLFSGASVITYDIGAATVKKFTIPNTSPFSLYSYYNAVYLKLYPDVVSGTSDTYTVYLSVNATFSSTLTATQQYGAAYGVIFNPSAGLSQFSNASYFTGYSNNSFQTAMNFSVGTDSYTSLPTMEAEGFFSLVNANNMTLSGGGDILRIASPGNYSGYIYSNYLGNFGFWDGSTTNWYITKDGTIYSKNLLLQGDGTNCYIRPTNTGTLYIGLSSNPSMITASASQLVVNQASKIYCGGLGTGGSYVFFRGINGNFPIIDSTDDLASHNTAGLGLAVLGTTVLTVRSYPYNYTQLEHLTGTVNAAYYNLFTYNGAEIGSISQYSTTNILINGQTSDERLKNDCGIATDTSIIDDIKIHKFTWKEDGTEDIGVFAQEAYEILPKAIKVGNDELTEDGRLKSAWGVDYSKFVPYLIVYCQQLKNTVKTMEERILALESKIV
jgi:hypothetical protein